VFSSLSVVHHCVLSKMSSQPEVEKRLREVRQKLAEIEALKQQEPSLRREESTLVSKLKAIENGGEADPEEVGAALVAAQEVEDEKPKAPLSAAEVEEAKKKRIKALNKKIQQIAELKTKDGPLDPEAKAKVQSEPKLRYELDCIKNGVAIDPYWEPAVKTELLPRDPAEREKRVKALRKKAQQIDALKEREGELDAEARSKIESERGVLQEIAALESGASEVVFAPPNEEEKAAAALQEKNNVERKLKAIKKKLDQVEALKKKGGNIDADGQAKLDSEATIKKELGAMERRLGELNKEERNRVAQKLGFEEEAKANLDAEKKKKKGR